MSSGPFRPCRVSAHRTTPPVCSCAAATSAKCWCRSMTPSSPIPTGSRHRPADFGAPSTRCSSPGSASVQAAFPLATATPSAASSTCAGSSGPRRDRQPRHSDSPARLPPSRHRSATDSACAARSIEPSPASSSPSTAARARSIRRPEGWDGSAGFAWNLGRGGRLKGFSLMQRDRVGVGVEQDAFTGLLQASTGTRVRRHAVGWCAWRLGGLGVFRPRRLPARHQRRHPGPDDRGPRGIVADRSRRTTDRCGRVARRRQRLARRDVDRGARAGERWRPGWRLR